MLVSVEADSIRTQPPITPPPPVQSTASIQRGDSLASFLERHGINQEELKQFNPGLTLSDLSVGTEVRVAKAATGQQLLAIRPNISGGASWPDLPALTSPKSTSSDAQRLAPSSTYSWPTKGVFTSGYGSMVGCTRELTLLTAPERLSFRRRRDRDLRRLEWCLWISCGDRPWRW